MYFQCKLPSRLVTTCLPHREQNIESISGGITSKQTKCVDIFAVLPPELLGCRRTTCSRVSLMFSSSSSDRASAISPLLSRPPVILSFPPSVSLEVGKWSWLKTDTAAPTSLLLLLVLLLSSPLTSEATTRHKFAPNTDNFPGRIPLQGSVLGSVLGGRRVKTVRVSETRRGRRRVSTPPHPEPRVASSTRAPAA